MAGGLDITWNLGRKKGTREEDERLFRELLDKGYQEDSAAYIVEKARRTGVFNPTLPNYQNDLNKTDTPNRPVPLAPTSDIPERSTLRDFLPMQQDVITVLDKNNPTHPVGRIPVPRGQKSVGTMTIDSAEPQGENIYVDAKSGDEVRREKNGTKSSRVIKVGSTSNGPGKDSPDVALKKRAIAKIMDLQSKGLSVPQELIDMAQTGEEDIGVSVDQPVVEPGAVRKFFGAKPKLGEPVVTFKGGKISPKQKAIDWLKSRNQLITPANIQAVIQAGKV